MAADRRRCVAVLGLACTAFLPAWWFRVHRWEVTDEAVYVRTGGVLAGVADRAHVPDPDRGHGARTAGAGCSGSPRSTVTTASSKGAIKIEGLDHELAAELAEQLTRITQATPGDAT